MFEDIKREVDRQKKLTAYDAALQLVDSSAITRQSSKVADILVTDAWRDRFATEVRRLGLQRINVELKRGVSSIGAAQFSVVLTRNPEASIGRILSEGEHRCIAIAAFLSELATTDDKSALIFDDPVSSLDHDYREDVAKRLVDEVVARRQVIVFTHDVLFVEQLSRLAREQGVSTKFQTVSQVPDSSHCGSIEDGVPPTIAPALDLSEGLTKQVKHWEGVFKAGQLLKWNQQTNSVSIQLRKCWERAVAEILEPVVRRFDSHVQTKNVWQISALEESDFVEMRKAYKRCSELNHEKCAELGRKVPTPDDYYKEIEIVKDWMQRVRSKQLAAQNHPPIT